MKTRLTLGTLMTALALGMGSVPAHAQDTAYLYAYFEGPWPVGGESGVYLAYSDDGYNFTDMNGGNAILSMQGVFDETEDMMRDPSVLYGPDGKYHMVWTTSAVDVNRNIGYAWSYDLKTWNDVQLIEVFDPVDTPNISHTWAPDIEYIGNGEYEIIFTADPNGGHLALWSTTTSDFVNFTTPVSVFDPGSQVIDGDKTYDPDTGTYVMPVVIDQGNPIHMATSATGDPGTWVQDNNLTVDVFTGPTEGPSLIKIGDLWHMYIDYHSVGILGMATSPDLVNWTEVSDQATLPNGRHGAAFAAPLDTIAFSLLPYGRSDLDGNETINVDDWLIFTANHLADLSGLTPEQQAALGDLNGDGVNNFADFREFKDDYDAYNGAGAFAAMMATIPEPASALSLTILGLTMFGRRSWSSR